MAVTCSDIIKLIAAFLLPPLGVFLVSSRHRQAEGSLSEAFECAYSDGVCLRSGLGGVHVPLRGGLGSDIYRFYGEA